MKTRALLCVDDDLGILEFYETLLASEGYEALLARDAHQALQLFDSRKDEISVVMSDFSMSEMNGLAAKLKRRDPSVPVILISGCQPVLPENHRVDASLSKGAFARNHFEPDQSLSEAEWNRPSRCDESSGSRGNVTPNQCREIGISDDYSAFRNSAANGGNVRGNENGLP